MTIDFLSSAFKKRVTSLNLLCGDNELGTPAGIFRKLASKLCKPCPERVRDRCPFVDAPSTWAKLPRFFDDSPFQINRFPDRLLSLDPEHPDTLTSINNLAQWNN